MKKLSTFNSQLSTPNGFTLIELLVVIGIMVFVGGMIGSILFSSLRGTNKTNTITVVRQNGSFAITQMAKMIRNAREFNGVSTDGSTFVTDCSKIVAPTPSPAYVSITSFDGGTTTFSCCSSTITSSSASLSSVCSPGNYTELIDTNVVKLDSCSFSCTQSGTFDYPNIGINFSLSAQGTNLPPEKSATIPFQTSIILRNVGR
ncbi:MAG: type II secretion system protein [Candidatus Levybacteria bacterium]|nr:type II secretion system protein [Candidatus Levybacteria bacterium]